MSDISSPSTKSGDQDPCFKWLPRVRAHPNIYPHMFATNHSYTAVRIESGVPTIDRHVELG